MHYSLKKGFIFFVTLAGGVFLGRFLVSTDYDVVSSTTSSEQLWSCPMHPQITAQTPSNCSICGMNLALRTGSSTSSPQYIEDAEELIALSNISTSVVRRGPLSPTIYLQGQIKVQPAQRYILSTSYAARVEDLYLDTEGIYVHKGQPIARLYASELETTQITFLQSQSSTKYQSWHAGLRTQLEDWGMSDAQINDLAAHRKPSPYLELLASRSGHLLRTLCRSGETLKPGAAIYEIADLSELWLDLEASPKDLPWLKKGLSIPFRRANDNYARFSAQLQQISITTNPKTGNLMLQALIEDTSPELRPGIYVESYLRPPTQAEGLLVPRTAVLWTGKESVVYLRSSDPNHPNSFLFKVIELGDRFGDYYLVHSGLEAGDEVVTEGALSIDATMQLQGKLHMMSPTAVDAAPPDSTLNMQLDAYFKLTEALVASDEDSAQKSATAFASALQKSTSNTAYTELNKQILPLLEQMETSSLDKIRNLYAQTSDLWIKHLPQLGVADGTLYEVYCPMAIDYQGARWIWKEKEVLNPYFGASMLKCGRVVAPIKSKK